MNGLSKMRHDTSGRCEFVCCPNSRKFGISRPNGILQRKQSFHITQGPQGVLAQPSEVLFTCKLVLYYRLDPT